MSGVAESGTSEGRRVTDGVGELDGDIGDGGEDASAGDGGDGGREDIMTQLRYSLVRHRVSY